MHPLTEEICKDIFDASECEKNCLDVKIRRWLIDKSREFAGVCTYDFAKEILELPEVAK